MKVDKLNPFKIILIWICTCITIALLFFFILGFITVGGEQRPLSFLVSSIYFIVYSSVLLYVIMIFIFPSWNKRYWPISFCFITIGILFFYKDINEKRKKNRYFEEILEYKYHGQTIQKTVEYYDPDFKHMRSVSYLMNGMKDSVWQIFAEDGKILSTKKFKNDQLIIDSNIK